MTVTLFLPLLAVLILIGLGFLWLVHHHFLKPVMGALLVVAGMAILSMLSYRGAERRSEFSADRTASASRSEGDLMEPMKENRRETPLTAAPAAPSTAAGSPLPDWVGQSLHLEHWDSGDVHVVSVTSGLYQTLAECEAALATEIDREVRAFAEKLDPAAAGALLTFNDEFRRQLIHDEHHEVFQSPTVGQMHRLDARLAFNAQVRGELAHRVQETVINNRLKITAAAGAAVLLVLFGVFSILRRSPNQTGTRSKPLAVG